MSLAYLSNSSGMESPAPSIYPTSYRAPSSYPPSLVSNSTMQSHSSARTTRADSIVRQDILVEDDHGMLQAPQPMPEGMLECSLKFLACSFRSNNLAEWDTHCKSHFNGQLPETVTCPFRCAWTETWGTGEEAWTARSTHIHFAHQGDTAVDTTRRPEQYLLQYLRNKRIIDDAQFKDLRMTGRLTETQVFVRSAGPARERRMNRRRHAVSRT